MRSSRAAIAELEQQGRLEEALAVCDEALERNPEQKELLRSRAALLARLNRKEEAILSYQELAQAYAQEGRPVQALAQLAEIQPLEGQASTSAYAAAASLRQALRDTPSREIVLPEFFRRLEAPLIAALLESMVKITAADGDIVIAQGEEGSDFFLLVEGQLRIVRDHHGTPQEIGRLHPGQGFGEIALLTPLRRTATIQSDGPSSLLRLGRADLERLGQTYPILLSELRSFASDRLFSNLFSACPLFHILRQSERWALSPHFQLVPIDALDTPLVEGHPVEGLFVVAGGRLSLYRSRPDGQQACLETLSIGSFFGEESLQPHALSSVTALASEASLLVKIHADDLPWITEEYPAFTKTLRSLSLERRRRWSEASGE